MRQWLSPPRVFTVISLCLITLNVAVSSLTQASFFRQAIIDRESVMIKELVGAHVLDEISVWDMEHYDVPAARANFERSFKVLKGLTGSLRIKLFNSDGVIVWSDAPQLIGQKIPADEKELTPGRSGKPHTQAHAVFITPEQRAFNPAERLPHVAMIEFYVPLSLRDADGALRPASGVLSIYRYPRDLNDTIRHGLSLLWLTAGLGGLILFVLLHKLFVMVYSRQREAETRFAELSADHKRILQIEKLSAMGQLVGEIAHQLNNPLVGVINLAQLAQRESDHPERVRELLGEVHKAGEHCHGFVQRMLRFTRVGRSEPKPTELKQLVSETIGFFTQSTGAKHEVTLAAPQREVNLTIDPVLMRHALFNLINNAAQADPEGTVTVSIAPDLHEGKAGWRLAVADCGPGIDVEQADKLFTPFFTTKPEGTGLGLAVTQHIVLQHGGTLSVGNNPGGGACFSIWLPEQSNGSSRENKNSAGR